MPIVEAVMSASMDTPLATAAGRPRLSTLIEAAMSAAVTACMKEGITDPKAIKARMLEARAEVKAGLEKASES